MKKATLYLTSLIMLVLFISTSYAEEVSKSYSKEYDVKDGATLKVSNKYGSIKCRVWEKNSIKIDVLVTVDHSRESKARDLLDKIDIDFSGSNSLVEAVTEMKNLNCNGSCEIDVDYTIMHPSNINVDLLMKYGILVVSDIDGEAKLGVKYGDLEANNITGDAEIYLGYSDADIEDLKNAKIEIKYSDMELENVNELTIKTEYSDVEIGKAYSMLMNTNYDDIQIGEAYSADISANFSDLEIGLIAKDLMVDINYGEIEVEKVKADFNKIEIYSSYADAKLDIDEGANYTIEAYVNYGDLDLSDDSNVQLIEKSYTSSKYKGYVGKSADAKSSVFVKCKHAGVIID